MLHSINFRHFPGIATSSIPQAEHIAHITEGVYEIRLNGKNYSISLDAESREGFTAYCDGVKIEGKLKNNIDVLIDKLGFNTSKGLSIKDVAAPMPGLVLSITVKPQETVSVGDPLLILEAMKMENIVKSPVDGTVESIEIVDGDAVEKGQILVRFQ